MKKLLAASAAVLLLAGCSDQQLALFNKIALTTEAGGVALVDAVECGRILVPADSAAVNGATGTGAKIVAGVVTTATTGAATAACKQAVTDTQAALKVGSGK